MTPLHSAIEVIGIATLDVETGRSPPRRRELPGGDRRFKSATRSAGP